MGRIRKTDSFTVKLFAVNFAKANKIFITFVACMLLKKQCELMQRLVSVSLYGNVANKQACGACYTLTMVIYIIL